MIRAGAYVDLPAGDAFRPLHARTRSLTGLLTDLGQHARDRIVVAVPFITAKVADEWLSTWLESNADLNVVLIHRQVPATPSDAERLRTVLQRWASTGRVAFRTFPIRDPVTLRIAPGPTFHCKLIEIDRTHLIMMSANFNEHSRSQNAEVAYVFGPREAADFRRFLRRLEVASTLDPMAVLP